jgi:hypothetical protein
MFFDGLDDLIAMAGFLAQQQQYDQLQVSGGEHLRGAHTGATRATPAESAAEEAASAAAAKVPVAVSRGEKLIYMSKHELPLLPLKNISYDISKVKNCFNGAAEDSIARNWRCR